MEGAFNLYRIHRDIAEQLKPQRKFVFWSTGDEQLAEFHMKVASVYLVAYKQKWDWTNFASVVKETTDEGKCDFEKMIY